MWYSHWRSLYRLQHTRVLLHMGMVTFTIPGFGPPPSNKLNWLDTKLNVLWLFCAWRAMDEILPLSHSWMKRLLYHLESNLRALWRLLFSWECTAASPDVLGGTRILCWITQLQLLFKEFLFTASEWNSCLFPDASYWPQELDPFSSTLHFRHTSGCLRVMALLHVSWWSRTGSQLCSVSLDLAAWRAGVKVVQLLGRWDGSVSWVGLILPDFMFLWDRWTRRSTSLYSWWGADQRGEFRIPLHLPKSSVYLRMSWVVPQTIDCVT